MSAFNDWFESQSVGVQSIVLVAIIIILFTAGMLAILLFLEKIVQPLCAKQNRKNQEKNKHPDGFSIREFILFRELFGEVSLFGHRFVFGNHYFGSGFFHCIGILCGRRSAASQGKQQNQRQEQGKAFLQFHSHYLLIHNCVILFLHTKSGKISAFWVTFSIPPEVRQGK